MTTTEARMRARHTGAGLQGKRERTDRNTNDDAYTDRVPVPHFHTPPQTTPIPIPIQITITPQIHRTWEARPPPQPRYSSTDDMEEFADGRSPGGFDDHRTDEDYRHSDGPQTDDDDIDMTQTHDDRPTTPDQPLPQSPSEDDQVMHRQPTPISPDQHTPSAKKTRTN